MPGEYTNSGSFVALAGTGESRGGCFSRFSTDGAIGQVGHISQALAYSNDSFACHESSAYYDDACQPTERMVEDPDSTEVAWWGIPSMDERKRGGEE